jgi:nucleosome binding factor SPN SPT16 subunit
MEQQERKRRAMLNKEVKAFAEKIAEAGSTSVRLRAGNYVHSLNVLMMLARRSSGTGYSI